MNPSFNERVKDGVLHHPLLLDSIYTSQYCNKKIFSTTIQRLLPYRTSVEIEFAGSNGTYEILVPNIKFDIDKLYNAYLVFNEKSAKHYNVRNCHLDNVDFEGGQEIQISINHWKHFLGIKNLLEDLQKYCYEDESGSIHIHIDISDWVTSKDNAIYHYLGLKAFEYLNNFKDININNILNVFLDTSIRHFDRDPSAIEEYYSNHRVGNKKNLHIYSTLINYINTIIPDEYNNCIIWFDLKNVDRNIRNRLTSSGSKFNWINMRPIEYPTSFSIEYRSGKCSLDYDTIIRWMVNLNALTRQFLRDVENLGRIIEKEYRK